MSDGERNMTDLTLRVRASAAAWLDRIGVKPIETEVPVAPSWIADLAGLWRPTCTELQNAKIIPRAPSYNFRMGTAAAKRYTEGRKRTYDAYEAIAELGLLTIVVEVKTSRGDFRGDPKWSKPLPASLCVLAITTDAMRDGEAPEGWHVITCSPETGKTTRIIGGGRIIPQPSDNRLIVAENVAVRQDHRARHKAIRKLQSQVGVTRTRQNQQRRLSTAIRIVQSVAFGEKTAEEAIDYYAAHWESRRIPSWDMERLQQLQGIAKRETGET